jgi:nucleoside-diphosphate-sugar epimerase
VIGSRRVAVFGSTGFVGRAVVAALAGRGFDVVAVRTPRLDTGADDARALAAEAERLAPLHEDLTGRLAGVRAVVNAAGDPDASSLAASGLVAANALVPGLLCATSRRAGVNRFVHLSSAVVQGDADVLDTAPAAPGFSPYSRSKALGEQVLGLMGADGVVVYRPPSVHASDRRVTRMTARIARSRLSSVAGDGTSPTPQALLENVGDAVAFLAITDQSPPPVVIHPWEGMTTGGVLELLGQKRPHQLPVTPARVLVTMGKTVGRRSPTVAANARRVEMLWFGQRQAGSWLTQVGWTPPLGREGWVRLGDSGGSDGTPPARRKS